MKKTCVNSPKAPAALGPYSHAAAADDLIFVSGQLPMQDGILIMDDISLATKACMNNIRFILEAAGSGMEKILKCTIYLKNMDDFAVVNEAYGSFFSGDYPSRVCVEVARLPKNVNIEIDAIAVR